MPLASITLGAALAALGIGLLVFLAAWLGLAARDVKRLRKRVEAHLPADEVKAGRSSLDFRAALTRIYAGTERLFDRMGLMSRIIPILERAGSSLRPAELFYLTLGSGFGLSVLLALVHVPAVILLVIIFPIGAFIPYAVLSVKASKRQQAFDDQLPSLLMSMAASVRVGHSFRQAVQAVVNEGTEPARTEFNRVLVEADLGRPMNEALAEMAERMSSSNFEYLVQTVAIQHEVGGSLAGLFDLIAETVRLRQQFQRRVRSLTAQARISAKIVTVMPFVALGVLSLHGTKYVSPLFTTSTGRLLLIIGFVGVAIGGLILRKMVAFRMA